MSKSKKTAYVIINPVSGTGSKEQIADRLQKFDFHGCDMQIFWTEYPNHATQITSAAVTNKIDYVFAVGGDGTINEVAKALVGTDTVLGIIPHGSGNGLARHLNIPINVNKALLVAKQHNVQIIDYGIANGNLFFCTCGVGYDAQVSEKSLHQKSRGKVMYAKNMVDVFYQFEPENYKITTSEHIFEGPAFTVTCANASQYGNNAYIAPNADIQDGKMNVAILKPLSVFNLPKIAIQMFTKRINDNCKHKELITPNVLIERERKGVMHLDGNAIYTEKDIHIEIIARGLKVLVSHLN